MYFGQKKPKKNPFYKILDHCDRKPTFQYSGRWLKFQFAIYIFSRRGI